MIRASKTGLLKALVGTFKIDIAEQANMLYAAQQIKRQRRQTLGTDALAAVFLRDVNAFQIDYIAGFGNDVSLKDERVTVEHNKHAFLLDPSCDPLKKSLAVLHHRINAAFGECNLGLSLGDRYQMAHFGILNPPFALLNGERKRDLEKCFRACQSRRLRAAGKIMPEVFG